MIVRRALLATFALAASAAAIGQDSADRTHLDEFEIAPDGGHAVSDVEQLGERETIVTGSAQPKTRDVAIAGTGTAAAGPVAQITTHDRDTRSRQLIAGAPSRDIAPSSVSESPDSRPGGVVRVGGTDRCDPQLAEEEAERCRAILELRAAEFQAAEPPRMSAEQVLLAQQGDDDGALALLYPDRRLAMAGRNPDADARSNQELASLIFDQPVVAASAATITPEEPLDQMAELLEALEQALPQAPQQ